MQDKGVCHRLTALNEIDELLERQVLEDIKSKPNNFSCIVARDENEYTRIYQIIVKIKVVIEAMDKPIEKLFLQGAEWASNSTTEEATRGLPVLQNLQIQLESGYRQRYGLMLQFLWDRTNTAIQSEKDKQNLHTMIVNLMMKINDQFRRHRPLKEIFKFLNYKPEILKPALWKKMGITKELMDELNAPPEDFVRLFPN